MHTPSLQGLFSQKEEERGVGRVEGRARRRARVHTPCKPYLHCTQSSFILTITPQEDGLILSLHLWKLRKGLLQLTQLLTAKEPSEYRPVSPAGWGREVLPSTG